MYYRPSLRFLAALAIGGLAAPCMAEELAAAPPDGLQSWTSEDPQSLAERRAGAESAPDVDGLLNATVSGNSIGDHSVTGEISIGDGAIQDVFGIFVATINTGSNVLIQTTVNMSVEVE